MNLITAEEEKFLCSHARRIGAKFAVDVNDLKQQARIALVCDDNSYVDSKHRLLSRCKRAWGAMTDYSIAEHRIRKMVSSLDLGTDDEEKHGRPRHAGEVDRSDPSFSTRLAQFEARVAKMGPVYLDFVRHLVQGHDAKEFAEKLGISSARASQMRKRLQAAFGESF